MKTSRNALLCLLPAAALLLAGCEADPVNQTVFITPDSAVMRNGEAVTFTASGGVDYDWSLEHESYGILLNRRGDTTTYVSSISPGSATNLQQILRVTSIVRGGATTNAGQVTTGTAEAFITHID